MRALVLVSAIAWSGCLSPPSAAEDGGPGGEGLRTRLITLHPPPVGLVTAVPVAIILPEDEDLAAAAREDGADIRVGDGPRGSELAHEIEAWDPDTGALVLWVLVPTVQDGTVLELRYGDGMERPQLPATVWLSYAGVWHLAGEAAGPPPQMADSTQGGNPGSTTGTPPASVPGVAGPALSFDGDGMIEIADSGLLDFASGSFAYEAWVRIDSLQLAGDYDPPWFKGGSSNSYIGYDLELGTGLWNANLNDGVVGRNARFSSTPILGAWAHLVAVVDRQDDLLTTYLDGTPADAAGIADLGSLATDVAAGIGGSPVASAMRLIGAIDEVRVSTRKLSPEEIAVEHANLRAPEVFLEVGDEQSAP